MKSKMISLEIKMTKEVYRTLTDEEKCLFSENRSNKQLKEIEDELISRNNVSEYVIYGGEANLVEFKECKIISLGVELGRENFNCYFNNLLIYKFDHYIAMGFSSQPRYLNLDYSTYKMLFNAGVPIEKCNY